MVDVNKFEKYKDVVDREVGLDLLEIPKKRDPTSSNCINDSMNTNEKVDETQTNNQSDINVVQNDSTANDIGTPEETKEGGTTNEVVVESVGKYVTFD